MNKNIVSQIARLDQEALQQQQLLYQQDFQVSLCVHSASSVCLLVLYLDIMFYIIIVIIIIIIAPLFNIHRSRLWSAKSRGCKMRRPLKRRTRPMPRLLACAPRLRSTQRLATCWLRSCDASRWVRGPASRARVLRSLNFFSFFPRFFFIRAFYVWKRQQSLTNYFGEKHLNWQYKPKNNFILFSQETCTRITDLCLLLLLLLLFLIAYAFRMRVARPAEPWTAVRARRLHWPKSSMPWTCILAPPSKTSNRSLFFPWQWLFFFLLVDRGFFWDVGLNVFQASVYKPNEFFKKIPFTTCASWCRRSRRNKTLWSRRTYSSWKFDAYVRSSTRVRMMCSRTPSPSFFSLFLPCCGFIWLMFTFFSPSVFATSSATDPVGWSNANCNCNLRWKTGRKKFTPTSTCWRHRSVPLKTIARNPPKVWICLILFLYCFFEIIQWRTDYLNRFPRTHTAHRSVEEAVRHILHAQA